MEHCRKQAHYQDAMRDAAAKGLLAKEPEPMILKPFAGFRRVGSGRIESGDRVEMVE